MNKYKWMLRVVVVGLTSAWLGAGAAEAGVIPPTDPATLKLMTDSTLPTVSLYQLDSTLPVSVTLSSPSRCTTTGTLFYKDVTDCWLPEWDPTATPPATPGKDVFIVINGATATATVTLVPPAPATFPLNAGATNPFLVPGNPTTSAYPGKCTNFGSDTGPDFTLGPSISLETAIGPVTGWKLTPNDCGGMAVIRVASGTGTFTYILPKDGTTTVAANGIPEIWESLYGGNLNASGDIDPGPGATSPAGDGLSTMDEWRGFIVSTKQVRTNPLLKDVFVHLVNAQCPTASSPAPGRLTPAGYPKPLSPSASATLTLPSAALGALGTFTFTASAPVFTSAHTLGQIVAGNAQARILAVTSPTTVTALITVAFASISLNSWQLSESLFGNVFGLLSPERVRLLGYTPDSPTGSPVTTNEWVDNFLSYTDAESLKTSDAFSDRVVNANRIYGAPQKGIRVIECLEDQSPSPYGWALGGTGSPNTIGNVVVYTARIITKINQLITSGGTRSVQYSPMLTYDSRARDWLPKTSLGVPTDSVRDFVISKALLFYIGMEAGHSIALNVAAASNPHFPAGTGDALDQGITVKVDKSTSGFNTFYIPTIYGTADQGQVLIK
jgi:hypothetical protein